MRAPSKSALKEILRKSLSGPETRILWNPLRNEDFGIGSKNSFLSEGYRFSPLKKSVKVANYKGNIFHGLLIPMKQPMEAEESIIKRFNVQNCTWTRQRLR